MTFAFLWYLTTYRQITEMTMNATQKTNQRNARLVNWTFYSIITHYIHTSAFDKSYWIKNWSTESRASMIDWLNDWLIDWLSVASFPVRECITLRDSHYSRRRAAKIKCKISINHLSLKRPTFEAHQTPVVVPVRLGYPGLFGCRQ